MVWNIKSICFYFIKIKLNLYFLRLLWFHLYSLWFDWFLFKLVKTIYYLKFNKNLMDFLHIIPECMLKCLTGTENKNFSPTLILSSNFKHGQLLRLFFLKRSYPIKNKIKNFYNLYNFIYSNLYNKEETLLILTTFFLFLLISFSILSVKFTNCFLNMNFKNKVALVLN